MTDYLDEDPVIQQQQYVVLSYAFSNQKTPRGDYLPIVKIRGSYKTLEECDKRIKVLADKTKDPETIAILKAEVGKWLGLYTYEELQKQDEIEVQYRNEELNEIMKGIRQSSSDQHSEFYDRLKTEREELKKNASAEGQRELNEKKEHPVSVYHRIINNQHTIGVLEAKLKEARESVEKDEELLGTQYTDEEIDNAKQVVENAMQQGLNAPVQMSDDRTEEIIESQL